MRHKASQAGFTLVEVLAALAVFSIAAVGISQSAGETTRGAAHMEAKFLASIVAENQLVEITIDPNSPQLGSASGTEIQRGRTFNWIRQIVPTERPDVIAISVTVQNPETEQVLARLETLRRVQP